MLTDDKKITTAEYWDSLYKGERNNAKVDSSNGIRTSTFDRFAIVADKVTKEEKKILDVGSGHAHICKRIKSKYPQSLVIASDQTKAAKEVTSYKPYLIFSAYEIPYEDKFFDLIIATQCMEYMENQDKFLTEAKRVAKKFLCTVPIGEMKRWSQLFIYNEKDFCEWISEYGVIEVKENYGEILLVKLKFYD